MLFRILLSILCVVLWSCSSLQRPSYQPQGEFETGPKREYLKSPKIQGQSTERKGPFQLRWPVRYPKISRGFRPPSARRHYGVDFTGKRGYRIYAAHDGVVVYAGNSFRGYGNMILLEYDSAWATLYGHLDGFRVKTGDKVLSGQTIGTMGRTGRATGVHLHFELIRKKQPIDPMPYLKGEALIVDL